MGGEKKQHFWLYAPLGWMLALVSLLPWRVLYWLSDLIFFLTYHIGRYRYKVVTDNLSKCFPENDNKWIRLTARKFYRYFADYIVETIKLNHVSDEEMKKRVVYNQIEIVDEILESGKPIVAYFAHCFNWEWAPAITLWTSRHKDVDAVFAQVYRPLKNKWTDQWLLRLRSRFGSHSFAKRTVLRDLIKLRRDNIPWMTGFMSDQKPSHGDPTLPLMFLNRPTAMITGTETLARKFGAAVVYMDIERLSRGYYSVTIRKICDDASTMPQHEVTRSYTALLEKTIRRNPPIWLWSHKRWKYPVILPENEN